MNRSRAALRRFDHLDVIRWCDPVPGVLYRGTNAPRTRRVSIQKGFGLDAQRKDSLSSVQRVPRTSPSHGEVLDSVDYEEDMVVNLFAGFILMGPPGPWSEEAT